MSKAGFGSACYKQTYLSYHIAKCESYKELLDLIKKGEELGNTPITSFSRSEPKEYNYKDVCGSIKRVRGGGPINWVTRAEGLRAKVAELHLANNYGNEIPEDIMIATDKITVQDYSSLEDKLKNKGDGTI